MSARPGGRESSWTTTTDAGGHFTLRTAITPVAVADSSVRVCAKGTGVTGGTSGGGYLDDCTGELSLTPATPNASPTIVLDPEARVTGIVVDGVTGSPLPGAHVALQESGTDVEEAVADSTGHYAIEGISPDGGTYSLCVRTTGHAADCATLAARGIPEPVAGTSTDAGTVRLAPYGSISGVVTGSDTGRALAGVPVILNDADHQQATTDADGRYAFTDLEPGPYHVTSPLDQAGATGYQAGVGQVTVPAGRNALVDPL